MVRAILITAALTTLASGACASGERRADDSGNARELASSTVITNDVLERLYGPAGPAPEPAPAGDAAAAALPDALEEIEAQAGARRLAREHVERSARRVAEAEAALRDLEARRLAIANPYLPRPVLTPEERDRWEGLDNVARVRLTEQAIVEARKELEAAREAYQLARQGG